MKSINLCLLAVLMTVVCSFGQTTKTNPQITNPFLAKQTGNKHQPLLKTKKRTDYSVSQNGYSYWFRFDNPAQSNVMRENFFNHVSETIKSGANDNFQLYRTETDDLGFTHYRFQQYYKGLKVYGGEMLLHEKSGKIQKANGKFIDNLNLNVTPVISKQTAVNNAISSITGKNHTAENTTLIIAPINGQIATENYRLCYKTTVTAYEPYQIYDVYVDANNGEVVNKISRITDADAVGSANTLYSGTKSITTDSYGGGYRLRESGRPIQTFNMKNDTDYGAAVDFTDSDNNWTNKNYTLEYITVSNVATSWWYSSLADPNPDLYVKVYDGSNSLVEQATRYQDTWPPVTFYLGLQLSNPPYRFELWDYDAANSDDFGGTYNINLNIGTFNFSGSGNSGSYQITGINEPALDVHWAMEKTYDFYLSQLGRNSFNNAGGIIKNYVHKDYDWVNANWNSQLEVMSYGDGDGDVAGPLTTIDIVGHEFTHAVVQYTAALEYLGESGALNESFADIFGTAIEFYGSSSPNWSMGENVFLKPPYFLRSMSNPNSGLEGKPDTYEGQFWKDPTNSSDDHGGVHMNSGVQNFWFYLLSQGGNGTNDKGNAYSVSGIGITSASKIAYRNLSTYLTSTSEYLDSYYGSLDAAEDLFGNLSTQFTAAKNAWYAVGIGGSGSGYCSGSITFTDPSGTFSDGSGTANYPDLSDCMWLILPTGANTITLSFSAFSTEQDYDGVIVYDGPDTSANVLGVFTGAAIPTPVTSTGGAMLVWFISDSTINAGGWTANYTSTGTAYCNGLTTLTNYSGSFTDGSGASNYGNNSECYWYIAPAGATSVTLSFSSFNTELNYDGIIVFDDFDGTNQLGLFTGTSIPSPVTSTTGKMLVAFISDYTINAGGFNASYTATGTPYCSGTTTLNSDYAILSDGSGNNNYYDNSNCSWLIQPTNAVSITLIFTEFNLEQPSTDGNSIYDYVEVYDGANTASPLIGKYSGSNIPSEITSSGSSLYLHFVSDAFENDSGWTAYYTTNTTTYCNGQTTLTASSASFNDGSGASQYGNNSDCTWLIQPTNATSITLTFSTFNTEQDYDGIIVYDGNDTTANILGTFTGTAIPSSVTSSGGAMLVWFISDLAVRGNGWAASYTSTTGQPCTGLSINTNSTTPNSRCTNPNGSAIVSASGGTPAYTYSWNNGQTNANLTNVSGGNYSVTSTDANGCSGTTTVTVGTNITTPTVTTSVTNETSPTANDGTATANPGAGTAPFQYSWNNGGTSQTISSLDEGTYTVTITDQNGCTASATATVGTSVGITTQNEALPLTIYPNPNSGNFLIQLATTFESQIQISVFNLVGQKVYDSQPKSINGEYSKPIELKNATEGIYFVKVMINGQTINKKVIIE